MTLALGAEHAAMRNRPRCTTDLHMHSTASDGLLSPARLCAAADERGMRLIALCDHDTLHGIDEFRAAAEGVSAARAAANAAPFTAIGGIELSSGAGGRVHILGYAPRADDPALDGWLRSAADDRKRRAAVILDKLRSLGVCLDDEREALLESPQVGRAHIARAMVRQGCVSTVSQAFTRYLAEGRPAYAPRSELATARALKLLRDAGAVTVLAHPTRLYTGEAALAALISELKAEGLQGIEAYHPSATRAQAAALCRMARRMGLLVTGGSDYHGEGNSRIGCVPSGWVSCESDSRALIGALGRQ